MRTTPDGTLPEPAAGGRSFLDTSEEWARFVSALVHELRTPIGSLQMLGELLNALPDGLPAGDGRRHAAGIQAVAQDLQGLVADAGQLARLAGGRLAVRSAEVRLGELVSQVETAARPYAWERGIALTEARDPALPPFLRTDAEHLGRALSLLLETAIGHAASEVFFRLDHEEGTVRVTVSCDGVLLPDDPERVFAPFFDGPPRPARRHGGRSLALPLARGLVGVLGGRLAASNRGGRPTFDLSLPLDPG